MMAAGSWSDANVRPRTDGIQFFTGATTSVNFDRQPRGFTL